MTLARWVAERAGRSAARAVRARRWPSALLLAPAPAAAQIGEVAEGLSEQLQAVLRFGVFALFAFGAVLLLVAGRHLHDGLRKSPWKPEKVRQGLILLACGLLAVLLPFLVRFVAEMMNPRGAWGQAPALCAACGAA